MEGTNKKIQVLKVTLTTNERYFEKGDLVKLNFNKLLTVDRPYRISKSDREEWTVELVPMDSYISETAEFIGSTVEKEYV